MRWLAVPTLLCLTLCCALAQPGVLLHSCESLDGVSVGMGRQLEATKLFVSHAAEHVTEGAGAVGAVSLAPEGTSGNTYISIYLPIEPTDFTAQSLVFNAATSTPDLSKAFYVRGYDLSGNIVISWSSWSGELGPEAREFALSPLSDSGGLTWEPQRIQDDDRSDVTRLEFITGTGEKGAYFNVTVDNVRAVPAR